MLKSRHKAYLDESSFLFSINFYWHIVAFFFNHCVIYLFIWLHQVLVAARQLLS